MKLIPKEFAEALDRTAERQSRLCLMCYCRGKRDVVSTMVSRDATGLEWFECEAHGPIDNLAGVVRVSSQPINDWLVANGLPPIED